MTTLLLPPNEIAMLRTMKGLAYILAVMITLDKHYPGRAFRTEQIALVAGLDARTASKQLQDLSALDRVILTSSGYVLTQGGRAMFLSANEAIEAQALAQNGQVQAQQALNSTNSNTHSVCALVVGGESLTTQLKKETTTTSKSAQSLRVTTAQIIAASPILFGEPGVVRGQLDIENLEPQYALAVMAHCFAGRKTRQNPSGLSKPAGLAYKMLLEGKLTRPEFLASPLEHLTEEYLRAIGLELPKAEQAQPAVETMQAEESAEELPVTVADEIIPVLRSDHSAVEAWETVLNQLSMEMNRTAFDNWCKRTKAIQYDGKVLTVGACNMLTVEWLESRISSSAKHLLVGLLGKSVDVRFVVSDLVEDLSDDE